MLKVSATSWHYRMRSRFWEDPPKDLCRYFWSCVASAIATFFLAIGYAIYFVLRPVGRLFRKTFKRADRFIDRHNEGLAQIVYGLLILAGVAVVVGALCWLIWAIFWNTEDFFRGLLVVLTWGGLIALGVAALALVLLAIAGIVHLIKRWYRNRPPKPVKIVAAKEAKPPKPKKEKKVKEGDSSWTLAWTFIMSKKRRVCPLIQVVGEDSGTSKQYESPFA